jgi:hypothetical protein
MNTNQGMFETLPGQAGERKDSPFSIVTEPAAQSPFTALEKPASPFSVAADAVESKPVKLPEKRKDSPFQMAESREAFGFEAPGREADSFATKAAAAFPQMSSPAASTAPTFSAPPQFSSPANEAFPPAAPALLVAAPAPAPAFAQASQPAADAGGFLSESTSIRQLELRAIFGVDRQLGADEMLQRARKLTGIRGVARVGQREIATIEGLQKLLPDLGFGTAPLRLYAGNVPIEFIREGSVVLAVQTDGGYAPGVRETLMIIARELGRIS